MLVIIFEQIFYFALQLLFAYDFKTCLTVYLAKSILSRVDIISCALYL